MATNHIDIILIARSRYNINDITHAARAPASAAWQHTNHMSQSAPLINTPYYPPRGLLLTEGNSLLRRKQLCASTPAAHSTQPAPQQHTTGTQHTAWIEAIGRGDDAVGNPGRARISQFDLFELGLLLKLDNQFPVEHFEPTVSQSTSSPLRIPTAKAETAPCSNIYIQIVIVLPVSVNKTKLRLCQSLPFNPAATTALQPPDLVFLKPILSSVFFSG